MPDFLPRREAELIQWTRTFTRGVVADPQAFGFDQAVADQLASLQAEYVYRYELAFEPSTRTVAAIRNRDDAKAALVVCVRELAALARTRESVSEVTLINVGLKRPSKSRARIPVPNHLPRLEIVDVLGPRVTLHATDSRTSGKRGLPRDVRSVEAWYLIGESPSAHRGDWVFAGMYSRARFVLMLPTSLPLGAKVWFAARWLNPRNKRGPWSDPCATRVLTDEVVTMRGRLNAA